jgi:hypothetical protein
MTKEGRQPYLIAGGMIFLAGLAFVSGRDFEKRRDNEAALTTPTTEERQAIATATPRTDWTVPNMPDVPFADLYEQLRFSSRETHLAMEHQIDAMPEGPERETVRYTYNKLLAQIAPQEAADGMLEIPNDTDTLQTIIGAAPISSMEMFARMILKLPGTLGSSLSRVMAFSEVIEKWSRVDPEAAISFLSESYKESDFQAYAASVIESWVGIDAKAAMTWVESRDDAAEFYSSLLEGWFRVDRAAAMDYAVSHATDDNSFVFLDNFAYSIFGNSPDGARDFINRLPSGEDKKKIIGNVATARGGDADLIPPSEKARWLMQFAPELWQDPMSSVITDWREQNAPEFFAWAEALPAETQDKIAAAYANIAKAEPEYIEESIRAAATATNAHLRQKLLRELISQDWSALKKESNFLDQLPISDAEKEALRELIPAQ